MKKTPKLRFPEFAGEWEEKKLSSVFHKVKNSVDVEENRTYKQIGIRSHGKGIFYKDEVAGKELGNKRVFWVEPNVFLVNIVFAWERAVARTTENEIGMIASHRFPMYKPKEKLLDLDYITYFFKTNKGKALLELASPGGAGRNKTLGQKEFDNLDIIIPKVEEQKKIASILSILDKKIEKQQAKVGVLEECKKGMMQKIFSQEIRFKDVNGEEYPEWEIKKFKDIIKDARLGGNYTNSEKETQYPLIKMGNLGRGKIVLNKIAYIPEDEERNNEDILKEGDLLFNTRNTLDLVGKVSVWRSELEVAYYNSNLLRLTFKEKYIDNNYFMNYLFNTNTILSRLKAIATGTTSVAAIYTRDLEYIKFEFPSKQEQQKISEFLSIIDKKLEKEQKKLDSLNQWKKGLLQQMFL